MTKKSGRTRARSRTVGRAAIAGPVLIAVMLGAAGAVSAPTSASAVYGNGDTSKGRYVDVIDWIQWGTRNNEVVLQNQNSSKTVTSTRQIGGQTLQVACTVSGLTWEQPQQTGQNGGDTGRVLTPPLVAYTPGSWAGDALDDLYNIGGPGSSTGTQPRYPDDFFNPNQMVIGLGNPNPGLGNSPVSDAQSNGARMSFDYSCQATLDGAPVPLEGLVFADAEASSSRNTANNGANNGPEWVQATTGAADVTWRLLEEERTCTQASAMATWPASNSLRIGVEGQECTYQNNHPWPYPDPDGHGPTAVAFIQNNSPTAAALSARVELQGRGYSAIALGYVLAADFGDAPASFGQAGALRQPMWDGGVIARGVTTNLSALESARYVPRKQNILGENIDVESTHAHSADAAADDGVAGAQGDEDGLLGSALAQAGYVLPGGVFADGPQEYSLSDVICYGDPSGPAYVAGWIDWNADGVFQDSERSATAECPAGGPHRITLVWSVPAEADRGVAHTFMRLRIAGDRASAERPTGLALTGEVEDYRVALPARVQVDKVWVIDGQTYPHGSQPEGIDASLTMSPAHAEPEWDVWQDGYRVGDTVGIGEAVDIADAMPGCTLVGSTLTGDGLSTGIDITGDTVTAGVTLTGVDNHYELTNVVECAQNLTLVKKVAYGDRSADQWRLSATGPEDARSGPDGTSGVTASVTAGVPYALAEAGPAEYLATEEGWQCVDDRTQGRVATQGDRVTLEHGQDVTCTITNTTAKLTLLKKVEGGQASPADWTLTADPGANDLGLRAHATAGSADAGDAVTWEIRPEQPYSLTEAPADPHGDASYFLDRVEMSDDGGATWRTVEPADEISVPAGTHRLYRFVNQAMPSLVIPLTGGVGRDAFVLAGGIVLIAGTALMIRRRRKRRRA